MADSDWRERFIGHLVDLEGDRGALAALRKGLMDKPGADPATYPMVYPWLPSRLPQEQEAAAFLVAGLFAMHPRHSPGAATLGASLKRLGDDGGSTERRFIALLRCNSEDLPHYLRQSVSLLRSKEIPINYLALLKGLLAWEAESGWVQKEWAREYWSEKHQETASAAQAVHIAQSEGGTP